MLDPETLREKRQESLKGLFLNSEFTVQGMILRGVYNWDLREYWVEALERTPSSKPIWKKEKERRILIDDLCFRHNL